MHGRRQSITKYILSIFPDGSHGVPNLFPASELYWPEPCGNPVLRRLSKAIPGCHEWHLMSRHSMVFSMVSWIMMPQMTGYTWAYDSTQNYSVIYGLNLATGTISESAPILTNGMFGSNSSKRYSLPRTGFFIEGNNGTTSATTACVDITNYR